MIFISNLFYAIKHKHSENYLKTSPTKFMWKTAGHAKLALHSYIRKHHFNDKHFFNVDNYLNNGYFISNNETNTTKFVHFGITHTIEGTSNKEIYNYLLENFLVIVPVKMTRDVLTIVA